MTCRVASSGHLQSLLTFLSCERPFLQNHKRPRGIVGRPLAAPCADWSNQIKFVAPVFRLSPLPWRARAAFAIEEVGVDRCGKARIIQLQAQVFAALVRFLRTGAADLGVADQNPVEGRVHARCPQVGDEAGKGDTRTRVATVPGCRSVMAETSPHLQASRSLSISPLQ